MLLFYESSLADLDVEVITACDGQDALAVLERSEPFDLILTDLNMPRMDGIELIRRARANPFFGGVPILMVTTESDGSQRQAAQNAGATGFVRKPFRPESLREAVERCLRDATSNP
jgi:two-component system chemotaxis response regulator CheY